MPNEPRPSHKAIRGHKMERYEVDPPATELRDSRRRKSGGQPRRRIGYRCQCRRAGTDYGTGTESAAARKHSAHLDAVWAQGEGR